MRSLFTFGVSVIIFLFIDCNQKPSFNKIETTLLSRPFMVNYSATGSGLADISLSGFLSFTLDSSMVFNAIYTFTGRNIAVSPNSKADIISLNSTEIDALYSRPPALKEAVVLGLTRMGIMHNLARISYNQLPERKIGNIKEWLTVERLIYHNDNSMSFNVMANGQNSASAKLWIDETGLPLKRKQTVCFPQGKLRVIETFSLNYNQFFNG